MAEKHPFFARLYVRVAAEALRAGGDDHRRELLAGLSGEVVEVGAGHGINFGFYPGTVTRLVAVEPEPYLRAKALEAAADAAVRVEAVDGDAERLPLPDASVDAAVASLVLCSVPEQSRALAELHRVLRPGGELRFYEHVRGTTVPMRLLQRAVDATIWPRVAGGCHTHRDTVAAIAAAGFEVTDARRFDFRACWIAAPVTPHVVGRAVRR